MPDTTSGDFERFMDEPSVRVCFQVGTVTDNAIFTSVLQSFYDTEIDCFHIIVSSPYNKA